MSEAPVIRAVGDIATLRRLEALQVAVWGEGDLPDPADLMAAVVEAGGLVAVASDAEGEPVGYLFGFPTRDPARQHSHRLGIRPDWQGRGLGKRLKLFQRDWCLAQGIRLVTWTFDPARKPNAALNIGVLGASARTYLREYYGEMAGINAGVPSDRLLVEWHLPTPDPIRPEAAARIVPLDAGGDDPLARRLALRTALEGAFAEGLAIRGFDPAGGGRYLLAP
ncbi:GNAT family N-acetyltransferase [Paracoccus panacisoli]|uniref:GNAT family N-acetyltransferase n=1 Tax=Paracoccus panacisoli TaxID=1510163 RepID=A0ABV6T4A1_9RHOB